MVHPSSPHLAGELVVPFSETSGLEQIELDVIGYFSFALKAACKHVALDMLAEQVSIAH